MLAAISFNTDFLTLSEPSLGDTWTSRLTMKSRVAQPQLVSLIMYVYNEGAGEMAFAKTSKNSIEEIYGHTPEVSRVGVGGILESTGYNFVVLHDRLNFLS